MSVKVSIAPPQEPQAREEWQNAIDAAEALLHIHSARLYGLIKGGPEVNIERCEEILMRGRIKGIAPSSDAVARYVAAYNSGYERRGREPSAKLYRDTEDD